MSNLERELADWNNKFGDENGKMRIPSKTTGIKEPCRHEPTLIFSAQGVRFYGASFPKVNELTLADVRADLLINLTGFTIYSPASTAAKKPLIKRGPRWFSKLFKEPRIDEIVINWPDYGVIDVSREFFETIWKAIKQQNKKNVVVFCVGGHGRTGTCVGCLMTVINGIHGGQAIKQVRDGYCSHAIETKEQETMVRRMTKRTIEKKGDAPDSK
jgi:protein-tyrosine phosphatase